MVHRIRGAYSGARLLHKLLLLYAVVFVGITASSLVSYRYSVNILREEAEEYSRLLGRQAGVHLEQTLNAVNSEIFGTYNLNVLLGETLSRPVADGEEAEYQGYMRGYAIQNAMEEITYSHSLIQWIVAVDKYGNDYLSSKAYFENPYDARGQMERDRQWAEAAGGQTIWRGMEDGSICLSRMIYNLYDMKYTGYVVVNISSERIREEMEGMGLSRESCVLVCDSAGVPMLAVPGPWPPEEGEVFPAGSSGLIVTEGVITKSGLRMITVTDIRETTRKITGMSAAFAGSCLLCLVVISLFTALVLSSIHRNVNRMMEGISRFSRGELDTRIVPVSGDEIGRMAHQFNEMAGRIESLIRTVEEEAVLREQAGYLALQSQYEALQSQVNPHFLFNALESINSVAKLHGDGEVSGLIRNLAALFRGNLERTGSLCPLKEEMTYISNYLELCRQMYPSRLTAEVRHEEELDCCMVPTFVLQPVVENAVVHGIGKKAGRGKICIVSEIGDGMLLLTVEDNGVGIEQERLSALLEAQPGRRRIGLYNVHQRIGILFGVEYGVSIDSRPGVGTRVTIRLPLGEEWSV